MGNCQRAFEVGLKEIAITDHSFLHLGHPIRKRKAEKFMSEVKAAREVFSDLKVIAGLECNLLDNSGGIDLWEQGYKCELIVLGYHKFVRPASLGQFFSFNAPLFIRGARVGVKRKIKTTDAFIKAMERFPVAILSHPLVGVGVDMKALSEAAAHFGVYIELNGRRIALTRADIDVALTNDANFIINSDAHCSSRVGDIDKPLAFAESMSIPMDRVANWDKLPKFRHRQM